MPIETILRSGNSVLRSLETGGGPVILQWLREWQEDCVREVASGKDLNELLRAQGSLVVLNRILGLRQEIHNYQDGIRSGAVQRV